MTPSKPTLPRNQAFVVQFRTRPRGAVLPQGYIYPKAERAVRDLLRKRAHLVRQHARPTHTLLTVIQALVGQIRTHKTGGS
jgi:hypothetical protein